MITTDIASISLQQMDLYYIFQSDYFWPFLGAASNGNLRTLVNESPQPLPCPWYMYHDRVSFNQWSFRNYLDCGTSSFTVNYNPLLIPDGIHPSKASPRNITTTPIVTPSVLLLLLFYVFRMKRQRIEP